MCPELVGPGHINLFLLFRKSFIKPNFLSLLILPFLLSIVPAQAQITTFSPTTTETVLSGVETSNIMRRVLQWQTPRLKPAKDWERGVMLAGITATYKATQDPIYRYAATAQGALNQWELGPRIPNADDQCVGQ
jgi:hypothetical protein